MTIAFLTLGCKLNYAESSTYERDLRAYGLEVVHWSRGADIYLINTCSVTATSDAKSRNLIRKVHRINPSALIFVTGCSAQLRRTEIEAIEGVSKVFGCYEKDQVVSEIIAQIGGYAESVDNIKVDASSQGNIFAAYSTGERTRSFLKVQDGCDNYCKYCTVPYARGASRNLPICQCVRMAEAIAEKGIKEIVLTGVNTGDFGRSTGESFLELLQALDKVKGIERYRISSIEPNLLNKEIIDWIASGSKFQPHFHIPLQSGSDRLLALMGRHYDTAFFADKIAYIRKVMEGPDKPKVFFGIDLMVGLPSETQEDFEKTIDFITQIQPAFIHVFPYSKRPGTPAADMPGQLSEETKRLRVAQLEDLCACLHEAFLEANKGLREKVLFESTKRGTQMEGYTGNYIRISRDYDPALVNQIVDIIL